MQAPAFDRDEARVVLGRPGSMPLIRRGPLLIVTHAGDRIEPEDWANVRRYFGDVSQVDRLLIRVRDLGHPDVVQRAALNQMAEGRALRLVVLTDPTCSAWPCARWRGRA